MDELIVKVLSGTATPSEGERVATWRAESPENEASFQATVAIWAATEPAPQEAVPAVPAAAALMARARGGSPSTRVRPFFARPARWGWAIAAGVAAVLLINRTVGNGGSGISFVADATPRTVTLEDGSVVKLAPGSRLEDGSGPGARTVTLTGRAFFAVTPDSARPFVVRAGAAETRVLGTRFEVSEEVPGEVRVVVVEGQVSVSTEAGQVDVGAGSVARATGDARPTVTATDDVFALLEWPGGVMVYQATPLAEVADEVGRYFQRDVEVRGEALRALRITGVFDGQDFADVVAALCDVSGAECTLSDRGAVIAPTP